MLAPSRILGRCLSKGARPIGPGAPGQAQGVRYEQLAVPLLASCGCRSPVLLTRWLTVAQPSRPEGQHQFLWAASKVLAGHSPSGALGQNPSLGSSRSRCLSLMKTLEMAFKAHLEDPG